MRFVFNEEKAAEAAAHLLQLSEQPIAYIKLLKLLYLADRECLLETGFPITGDRMVSMDKGPVLSAIYDRLGHGPLGDNPGIWFDYVSAPDGWDVRLLKDPPVEGALSDYEISVLHRIHKRFGHRYKFELVELVHDLPEWRDPHGSSLAIEPADILRAEGRSDQEIACRTELAEHFWYVERRAAR